MMDKQPRIGFRDGLVQLEGAQKSGAGVPAYMRWVNRRSARGIAAFAATLGLTPNMVTTLSALLSAAGLATILIAGVSVVSGVVAAVLLALGFAFDSADGQLARLTGVSGPSGEWIDHVVDAVRTPTVHVCVAVALMLHHPDPLWLVVCALCFAVLSSGQFTSQILAEQLVRNREQVQKDAAPTRGGGVAQSFLLLPTDTGVLCWSFLFWGAPAIFGGLYVVLFGLNFGHAVVSMRRKYTRLQKLGRLSRV